MNSVVMVTGGAGFVGSHLVDRLLAENKEVHVFDWLPLKAADNLKEARKNPRFKYTQGDIRSQADVDKFWVSEADTVFHFASTVGVHLYMKDPLALIDVTVLGTRYVLKNALRHGTKVIYSSTSEIYGKNPSVPWKEDADRVLGPPSVDRWSYSTSKAVCEHMLNGVHRTENLPVSIVRFFNAYGPRQNPFYVASQSVYKVLRNERPLVYDDGRQTRCFTYVSDIIDGVLKVENSDVAIGETFNLGNPIESHIGDVVRLVLEECASSLEPEIFDTSQKFGKVYEDIPRRVPAVEKASRLLGWSAKTPLKEGIRQTIEWARENTWWLEDRK